jgi:hypothetical protein
MQASPLSSSGAVIILPLDWMYATLSQHFRHLRAQLEIIYLYI